jgi:iron-sulfur cluster repair protein YtfE (RIC family)
MMVYCQSVRNLVQQPDNNLFVFLRKETELNRRLTDQLKNIDYRYQIQFESYEHQIKQIIERNHEALTTKLTDLLDKIDREGRALQEQTDTLRKELERYNQMPTDIQRHLDNITHMNTTLRSYLGETKDLMR